MHPTVAEILELPVVAAGRPVVRAGRSALDTRVRWVHVSELPDPAGTLSGGELVLSIGIPVSDPTTDPADYLRALRVAGGVALMIELGQRLKALPDELVQAARAMSFPLIELRRTVRFIEVTEAVLGRVLTEQHAQLRFSQRVADAFRGLAVDAARPGRVVETAAGLLGYPVVLEDLAHRVLAVAGGDPAQVLRDWTTRSRGAAAAEGWHIVPVGRPTARWGRLVVPTRVDDDRVPMVLVNAADTLTVIARLSPEPDPARTARSHWFADLLAQPRGGLPELRARAAALGLDPAGPFTVLACPAGSALPVPFTGDLPDGTVVAIGRAEPVSVAYPVATAEAAAFEDLPAAVTEAMRVLGAVPPGPARVWRSADLGIRGLVHELRDDPRLLAFVEDQLGPILRLDDRRRTDALRSLRAFAEADGVITAFATRIGTSRPSAYARVRRLGQLLGRDLTDPAVKLSLQVALLAADTAGIG
ncbi:PucR family transcriptional regulator [Pseudonocardia thermophila]|uniref:PucR family transcriptional regulator n=1 Tax=Pseudonocardia thermophila TaxID=1848 RepID=UPI00248EAEBF|nr:PucR family transcriptional regulator [Pseudonocardia thermophila]